MKRKKVLLMIMSLLLFIGFCNVIYARYVLTMNLGIKSSSKNFFFNVSLNSSIVEFKNNKAEIDLVIKNNNGANYNLFTTSYEISILNNDKFSYQIQNANMVNNTVSKTMEGNGFKEETIKIILTGKSGSTLNLIENLNIKVKANSPYQKEINLPVTVDVEDTVIPQVTLSASETAWTNKDVVLTAVFQDKESGIVGYSWTNTSSVPSSWTKIAATTAQQKQTFTVSSNLTKYIWVIDEDGNTNYAYVEVKNIDKVAPSIPSIVIGNISIKSDKWSYEIISSTSSDSSSGVKGYEFLLGTSSSFQTGISKVVTGTNNPNYIVKVRAVDNAGNYSEYSNTFKLNIERLYIRQLYQGLRGNGGGAEDEIDSWENHTSSVTAAQIARGVFNSEEASHLYSAVGKEEMVRRLYIGILGRGVDSSGLTHYTSWMTSDNWFEISIKILTSIVNSVEAQGIYSARGLITGTIE